MALVGVVPDGKVVGLEVAVDNAQRVEPLEEPPCDPEEAEALFAVFTGGREPDAVACFDVLPEDEGMNCKTIVDNPAISIAGYGCETFIMMMVDALPAARTHPR